MTLTLHAIGDVRFLAAILNGVAMLFNGEDLRVAAGIGALVGILLMALRALLSLDGRAPRIQEFLMALLLWLLLFEPKVTVQIEDIYRGETRVVGGVPLGPAISGAVISEIGLGLTQLFETAFSTPAMTRTGFAGSLELLLHLRRQIRQTLESGAHGESPAGLDVKHSIENYIADCTLTGVDLGRTPIGTLLKGRPLPGALRYDSDIYTTRLDDGRSPEGVSCREAWPRIEALFHDALEPALKAAALSLGGQGGSLDPVERIQEALDALNEGQRHAGDYVLEGVLVQLFENGLKARQLEGGEAGRLALIEGAIQQRNMQWAAEQTLFARLVRPVLTWIEGFSYAITPLMAFAIFLGTPGVRMCGQYVLMLLWIQCWMPILAIANLYITLAAEGSLAALAQSETVVGSISAYYTLNQELQNWLAVGGMLASATPAIALMLVYGGSVTATHFLGRLQGGDFIDEKSLSPSLSSTAPLLTQETRARFSQLKGLAIEGADAVLPTFTLDQGQGIEQQHGQRHTALTSGSLLEDRRRGLSSAVGIQTEGRLGQGVSAQEGSSQSATDQFIAATGESFSRRYRESGVSGDEMATLIGSALQGQFGSGKGGSGMAAGLSLALQERYQVGHQQADEIASDLSQQLNEQQGLSAAHTRALNQSQESGIGRQGTLAHRSETLNTQGLSQSMGQNEEDSQAFDERGHLGLRSAVSIGAREAGMRFAREKPLGEALDHALETVGLTGDAERLGQEWHHQGLIRDPDAARDAAGLALLTGHSPPVYHALDGDEQVLARTLGRTLLGDAFRGPYDPAPETPGSGRLTDRLDPEGLSERVHAAFEGASMPDAHTLEQASSRLRGEAALRVKAGDEDAEALRRSGQEARDTFEDQHSARFSREQRAAFAPSLKGLQEPGLAERLQEGLTASLETLDQQLGPLKETAADTLTAFIDPKAGSKETGNPPPEGWDERLKAHREETVQSRLDALKDTLSPIERAYVEAILREQLGLDPDNHRKEAARNALEEDIGPLDAPLEAALERLARGDHPSLKGLLRSLKGRRPERNSAPP